MTPQGWRNPTGTAPPCRSTGPRRPPGYSQNHLKTQPVPTRQNYSTGAARSRTGAASPEGRGSSPRGSRLHRGPAAPPPPSPAPRRGAPPPQRPSAGRAWPGHRCRSRPGPRGGANKGRGAARRGPAQTSRHAAGAAGPDRHLLPAGPGPHSRGGSGAKHWHRPRAGGERRVLAAGGGATGRRGERDPASGGGGGPGASPRRRRGGGRGPPPPLTEAGVDAGDLRHGPAEAGVRSPVRRRPRCRPRPQDARARDAGAADWSRRGAGPARARPRPAVTRQVAGLRPRLPGDEPGGSGAAGRVRGLAGPETSLPPRGGQHRGRRCSAEERGQRYRGGPPLPHGRTLRAGGGGKPGARQRARRPAASLSQDGGGGGARRPRYLAASRRGGRPARRQHGGSSPGARPTWRRAAPARRAGPAALPLPAAPSGTGRRRQRGPGPGGGAAPRPAAFLSSRWAPGMSFSLKMLPCKKRRAAAGPQSPREDGELPGADGGSPAKVAPAARAGGPSSSGPGVWRGPGEPSLKGGRRPLVRPAPGPAPEAPGAKEACGAAPLPEGRGSPEAAAAEGKCEGGPAQGGLHGPLPAAPRRGRRREPSWACLYKASPLGAWLWWCVFFFSEVFQVSRRLVRKVWGGFPPLNR